MRVLLIDDLRTIEQVHQLSSDDFVRVVRTFEDGINALKYEEKFDILYLDHDLGDEHPSHTGYDILNFLEENTEFLPERISIVSSNPVGRQKMAVVIKKLYGTD